MKEVVNEIDFLRELGYTEAVVLERVEDDLMDILVDNGIHDECYDDHQLDEHIGDTFRNVSTKLEQYMQDSHRNKVLTQKDIDDILGVMGEIV